MKDGRMCIVFEGEAYESFQNALTRMHGYGCTITPTEGEPFDAILLGPDSDAEDGATIQYLAVDESKDDPYDRTQYAGEDVVSAVVDCITIT